MSAELPVEIEEGIARYESGDVDGALDHLRGLLKRGDRAASLALDCITLIDQADGKSLSLRDELAGDEENAWGDLLENVGELSGFGIGIEPDVDAILKDGGDDLLGDDPLGDDPLGDDLLGDFGGDPLGADPLDDDPLADLALLEGLPPEPGAQDDDLFSELVDEDGNRSDPFGSLTRDDLVPNSDDPLADLGDDPLGDDPLSDDPLGSDPLASDPLADLGGDPLADPFAEDPLGGADDLFAERPISGLGAIPTSDPLGPDPLADISLRSSMSDPDDDVGTGTLEGPLSAFMGADELDELFNKAAELEAETSRPRRPAPRSAAPVKGLDALLESPSPEDSEMVVDHSSTPPPLIEPAPRERQSAADKFFGDFFSGDQQPEQAVTPEESHPGKMDRPKTPFDLGLVAPDESAASSLEDEDDLEALEKLFSEAQEMVDLAAPPEPFEKRSGTPVGIPSPADIMALRHRSSAPTPPAPLSSHAEFDRELTPAHGAVPAEFDRKKTGEIAGAESFSECQALLRQGEVFKAWMLARELTRGDDNPRLEEFCQSLHERLLGMAVELIKPLDRTPTLAIPLSEISSLPDLDHRAGYLLSQVDGFTPIEFLIDLGAMPREESALVLLTLEESGAIVLD